MNRKEHAQDNSASQEVGNLVTYAFGQGDWMTDINQLCAEIASVYSDMEMKQEVDQNRVAMVLARLAGVRVSMGVNQEYQTSKDAALEAVTQQTSQLQKDIDAYINPPQKKKTRSELRAIKKAAALEQKKVERLSGKVDVAAEQASELGAEGKQISSGLKETNKEIKSIGRVLKEFVTETIPNLIEIAKHKSQIRKETKAGGRMGWTQTKVDKDSAKENEGPSPENRKPSMK